MPHGLLRTRVAVAPTGYPHVGPAGSALCVCGLVRRDGDPVRRRIEDHEAIRRQLAFEAAIPEHHDWFGFPADEGQHPVCHQSDADNPDWSALVWLQAAGRVLRRDCSRPRTGNERSDGHCHDCGRPMAPSVGVRLERGEEVVNDALRGSQRPPIEQCGNLLMRTPHGHWTYQVAMPVDDLRERMTLVVREAPAASNTAPVRARLTICGRISLRRPRN